MKDEHAAIPAITGTPHPTSIRAKMVDVGGLWRRLAARGKQGKPSKMMRSGAGLRLLFTVEALAHIWAEGVVGNLNS